MTRQAKIAIFTILCTLFSVASLIGFLETGNILQALVIVVQIFGASIFILLMIGLFLWLGTKIFR